jgi:hypothetical protein
MLDVGVGTMNMAVSKRCFDMQKEDYAVSLKGFSTSTLHQNQNYNYAHKRKIGRRHKDEKLEIQRQL